MNNRVALSAAYFGFFALLGLTVPYLSVYLDGVGLDSGAIGSVLALSMAMRVISPFVWAYIADAKDAQLLVARVGAILALASFLLLYLWQAIGWQIAALLAFSFFWSAILAQVEVLTLRELGTQRSHYTRVRVWGSIGFIVVSVGGGWLIEHMGNARFVDIGSVLLLLLVASLWAVRNPVVELNKKEGSGSSFAWLSKGILVLLSVNFLLQFSHGPYYSFFVLYMGQLGISKTVAGILVGLGVTAEVLVFIKMSYWLERYHAQRILLVAVFMATVRWLLMAFLPSFLPALIVAQLLHAFSFAVAHAASIRWLYQQVPTHHQSKAQAIYASAGFGAGGVAGALLSGWLWHDGQGATLCYALAALATAVATVILWLWQYQHQDEAPAPNHP